MIIILSGETDPGVDAALVPNLHQTQHTREETGVVVVVYQCSVSNVMVTGDIEALLYSTVHAVLEF